MQFCPFFWCLMISGNLVNKVRCSVLVNVIFFFFFSFEWHPNLSTHHSLVAVLLPFQVDLVTGPVEPLTVNQCFSTKTFLATYCLWAEAFSVHVTEYIAGVWMARSDILTWSAVHLVTLHVFSCLFLTSDPTCVYCMWEVVYIVETELFVFENFF